MKYLFAALLFAPSLCQEEDTTTCPPDVAQHYCFDATCGVQLADDVVKDHLNCECTESHIGYDFTACDPETNTLSMFYFWKPPATCRGGTAELSPPIRDIDCNVTCKPGRKVDVTQQPVSKCLDCEPGRYSMGGGVAYDPPWSYLPPQFTSNCIGGLISTWGTPVVCNPWRPMDNYLDSGDNYEKANIENVLTYQIELVRNGRVEFEFKYDAEERYDIFQLFVDGDKPFEATTIVNTWTMQSVPLTRGFHTLRWVYKKDGSLSKGADKAFIRNIRIFGVRQFDAECLLCPPGRFSQDGRTDRCAPCPPNTYYRGYGATKCDRCHPWEKSFEGAAQCAPSLPCTTADFYPVKGPCVNNLRNVSYAWIEPVSCERNSATQGSEFLVGNGDDAVNLTKTMRVEFLQPFIEPPTQVNLAPVVQPWVTMSNFELTAVNITESDFTLIVRRVNVTGGETGWSEQLRVRWDAKVLAGVVLPDPTTEPCVLSPCKLGQQRNPASQVCEFCPSGKATGAQPGCVECGKGEGAKLYVAYADWTVSKGRLTNCSGDCGSLGWRPAGSYIESGAGHGAGTNVWFQYPVKTIPTLVGITYLLSCPEDSGYLEVMLDSIIVKRFFCGGCSTDSKTAEVTIDPSLFDGKEIDFVLKINFHKSAAVSFQHSCDVAQVSNLALYGPKTGVGSNLGGDGAVNCSQCDVGRASVGATCVDCEAGRFQAAPGTDSCARCPTGRFAYKSGMSTCLECGVSTTASANRTSCEGSCEMTVEGVSYNVGPLFDVSWNVPTPGVDPRFTYYVIMCSGTPPPDCQSLRDDGWSEVPSQVTQPKPIHMCVTREGLDDSGLPVTLSTNAGGIIGYSMLSANRPTSGTPKPIDKRSGVSVSMTTGSAVQCRTADGANETRQLTSYVHFICDSNGGYGDPVDVTPGKVDLNQTTLVPCVTHMEWVTIFGCPVCTINDTYYFDSVCELDEKLEPGLGRANRTYYWKEPKTCFGGIGLPLPTIESGCHYVETVPPSHIVMGKGAVAALAIIGTLVAIIAIVAVIYLVRKKRRLELDNQNLRHYAQLGDGQNKPKVPDVVELHT